MFSGSGRTIVVFLILALLGSGCARLVVPERAEDRTNPAEIQLARLSRINEDIPPYKGIGELSVAAEEGQFSFRGAWLGIPDGRFRVETLGMAGQPGLRLICDSDECHFIYSENGCLRKISSRKKNIGQLTGIDMDVADLVVLLGGGIPVVSHDAAWTGDPHAPGGPVITLHRRFFGEVQRIRFSPDMSRVREVSVFGFRGLKYRAEVVSIRKADGYVVPDVLHIDNEDAYLVLKVERAWFDDITYSPDAFIPDVPEDKLCY